jgi:hypothetical protein
MVITFCLNCNNSLQLESELTISQRVTCPHCQIEFEIINLDPLELDWVYDGPSFKNDDLTLYDEDWWPNSTSESLSPS